MIWMTIYLSLGKAITRQQALNIIKDAAEDVGVEDNTDLIP